jgi:hypothetical protein
MAFLVIFAALAIAYYAFRQIGSPDKFGDGAFHKAQKKSRKAQATTKIE